MIVEFFGPPGSGKTTFALALDQHLRTRNHQVVLRLSSRPGEHVTAAAKDAGNGQPAPLTAALRRLMVPACELIVNSAKPSAGPPNGHVADALIEALPPGKVFRSLRMRQYLVRLSQAWAQAAENQRIWIFDQAYVQAITSVAVVQPELTDEAIVALLDVAPRADLVIGVEAPLETIESRLERRKQGIGGIGRLLEETRASVSGQAQLARRVDQLLRRTRRQVLSIRSSDDEAPDVQVGLAEQSIIKTYNELHAAHP